MDKLDKKAIIINECSVIFGELQDCKCYVPRKFFRKSIKTIMQEFKKGLKQIDKKSNNDDKLLDDERAINDTKAKAVVVVTDELQKSNDNKG